MTEFNKTGYVAHFTAPQGRQVGNVLDVEAWHPETGEALVVDTKTGRLRPAASYSNFDCLSQVPTVVAALPGDGWRVEYDTEDEGGKESTPVVGWLVTSDGNLHALDVDGDGVSHDPTTVGNFSRLYHPDSSEEPR
ncbi:hypothetical protein FNQ90_07125 [Streptomyces alkaliphilus]|uniref:Uncharacterized protein n=1 Tax=Streptomyces alkaliphilus TaxID=1472722 RepID=A0A7W3TBM3_9ACTN|nr:hypothetical protein [Streptomyces alkaliphilus]MBB0243884.1 hypothetical protein [Streptomyces alkaliphilus]